MAHDARVASRASLAIADRRNAGEELAAAGLVAYPLLVLLTCFASGTAAGSAVVGLGHDLTLDADSDTRFAVLRTSALGETKACLAATRRTSTGAVLYLDANTRVTVTRAQLESYRVMGSINPQWLVGKMVWRSAGSDIVASVHRPLNRHASNVAVTTAGSEIYLPWPEGGGELVCLDVNPGPGAALPGPVDP
jgi:hypothetical protein